MNYKLSDLVAYEPLCQLLPHVLQQISCCKCEKLFYRDFTLEASEDSQDLIDLSEGNESRKSSFEQMRTEGKTPNLLCPDCAESNSLAVPKEHASFIMGLLGPMEVKCKVCDDTFKYTDEIEKNHSCRC